MKLKLKKNKKIKLKLCKNRESNLENTGIDPELIPLAESEILKVFADTLAPKPKLTINEWADKYRYLPEISTYTSGE